LFSATIISLAVVFTQSTAPKAESYSEARQTALEGRLPLVVFVGEAKRKIHGTVPVSVKSGTFEDYPNKCIIVSYPTGEWRATLPAGAVDADIDLAVKGEQPARAAYYAGPPVDSSASVDALDMVNQQRAQRGLRPYLRDDGLLTAARGAAEYRAARRMFGHTPNDFGYLPSGTTAACTGCAGNEPSWGFMACALYENWTYCGAAYVMGSDGRMYCHAYYR
jgi:uncharacterized protein YkwD